MGVTQRDPSCLNPHKCQKQGKQRNPPNLQGDLLLHLFPGKDACNIFVTHVFFFSQASDTKSSFLKLCSFILDLTNHFFLENSSQFLFKELKLFSTEPRNKERQHPCV